MLTTRLCPKCIRFINHISISILQTRSQSTTTNENVSISTNDDTDTNIDLDRNVSRLPDDVYQHFKGKKMFIHYF